jgi:hypothetical protein
VVSVEEVEAVGGKVGGRWEGRKKKGGGIEDRRKIWGRERKVGQERAKQTDFGQNGRK